MMILVFLATGVSLPALPSMPARVFSTYLEYDQCISDAAKALFKDRSSTNELFARAEEACSDKHFFIEAALDAHVGSNVRDNATDGVLNSAGSIEPGSVDKQIQSNSETLRAIDARTAAMFAAYLRSYRSDAK